MFVIAGLHLGQYKYFKEPGGGLTELFKYAHKYKSEELVNAVGSSTNFSGVPYNEAKSKHNKQEAQNAENTD